MKEKKSKFLFWLTRILPILFIAFISIFAFDAFEQPGSFWIKIAAFLIHLIPSFILLAGFFTALKWPYFGAGFFIFLGILYIILTSFKFSFLTYFFISGQAILIGILFILEKYFRKKKK